MFGGVIMYKVGDKFDEGFKLVNGECHGYFVISEIVFDSYIIHEYRDDGSFLSTKSIKTNELKCGTSECYMLEPINKFPWKE
jgi:hypothetical protein